MARAKDVDPKPGKPQVGAAAADSRAAQAKSAKGKSAQNNSAGDKTAEDKAIEAIESVDAMLDAYIAGRGHVPAAQSVAAFADIWETLFHHYGHTFAPASGDPEAQAVQMRRALADKFWQARRSRTVDELDVESQRSKDQEAEAKTLAEMTARERAAQADIEATAVSALSVIDAAIDAHRTAREHMTIWERWDDLDRIQREMDIVDVWRRVARPTYKAYRAEEKVSNKLYRVGHELSDKDKEERAKAEAVAAARTRRLSAAAMAAIESVEAAIDAYVTRRASMTQAEQRAEAARIWDMFPSQEPDDRLLLSEAATRKLDDVLRRYFQSVQLRTGAEIAAEAAKLREATIETILARARAGPPATRAAPAAFEEAAEAYVAAALKLTAEARCAEAKRVEEELDATRLQRDQRWADRVKLYEIRRRNRRKMRPEEIAAETARLRNALIDGLRARAKDEAPHAAGATEALIAAARVWAEAKTQARRAALEQQDLADLIALIRRHDRPDRDAEADTGVNWTERLVRKIEDTVAARDQMTDDEIASAALEIYGAMEARFVPEWSRAHYLAWTPPRTADLDRRQEASSKAHRLLHRLGISERKDLDDVPGIMP